MDDAFDLVLHGGTLVDGTGAPARQADVAIRGGRVAAIGALGNAATAEHLDVTGLVVAPGFVDLHTHYDVQALWDDTVSPSPLHGVTTVIGGNCGFSIAPLDPDHPEHTDYVQRMMARVEGMPLEAIHVGPPWDWRGFGEFLARLEGRLLVNAGFLAGHSTIRRLVMGDRAVDSVAEAAEVAAMVELLHAALADGALGFSSSLGEAHTDGDGRPVPSRAAEPEEFLALARAAGEHDGTTLEFIAAMGEIPAARIELMTAMSLGADRPLNWNLLGSLSPTEVYTQQLTACDHATAHGATVVALALPDLLRMRAGSMLGGLPEWGEVLQLRDIEARRAAVDDPERRARLRTAIERAGERGLQVLTRPELIELAEAPAGSRSPSYAGRTLAAVAAERGTDAIDVLLDVVVPEAIPLTMVFPSLVPSLGVSPESWRARGEIWNDPRVVLGGSDAGAHLDLMCHANYTTVVLGEMVRERGLFTMEDAVRRLSDVPARLLGLRDRGRVALGWHADLVVFDPARVGSDPAVARHDLPGGALRLVAEAVGIRRVLVGGHTVVCDGAVTGARPGTVLRSGVDTDTVTVPGGSHRIRIESPRDHRGTP